MDDGVFKSDLDGMPTSGPWPWPDDCVHCITKKECIYCSPEYVDHQMMVLKCVVCSKDGGQTWHKITKEQAQCAKCKTTRDPKITSEDMAMGA